MNGERWESNGGGRGRWTLTPVVERERPETLRSWNGHGNGEELQELLYFNFSRNVFVQN